MPNIDTAHCTKRLQHVSNFLWHGRSCACKKKYMIVFFGNFFTSLCCEISVHFSLKHRIEEHISPSLLLNTIYKLKITVGHTTVMRRKSLTARPKGSQNALVFMQKLSMRYLTFEAPFEAFVVKSTLSHMNLYIADIGKKFSIVCYAGYYCSPYSRSHCQVLTDYSSPRKNITNSEIDFCVEHFPQFKIESRG